jgi:hypothetical protein
MCVPWSMLRLHFRQTIVATSSFAAQLTLYIGRIRQVELPQAGHCSCSFASRSSPAVKRFASSFCWNFWSSMASWSRLGSAR